MRTSKTISTISYNSKEFLEFKLMELVDLGFISDWFFIQHKKEEDETKDHIHLWLKPNRLLDTLDLQKQFVEINLLNPKKPFKCIDFVISKPDDAILYFLHDKKYLAFKGQTRKYHYLKEDIVCQDEDNFEELYNHAYRGSDFALKNQMIQSIISHRDDLSKLIESGIVPLSMASNLCII